MASEYDRRVAEIMAQREREQQRAKMMYAAQDLARYVITNLATAAAQRDPAAALEALQACKRELERIASA